MTRAGISHRVAAVLPLTVVGAIAFAVRLTPILLGGGLGFYGRYDDGVYFAAADALTAGRMPYRDFVLLHPPGITLVLAPFALLGHWTSDSLGWATARLFFMGVGAVNAVLVARLAGRWSRRAGLIGGVLYACWQPAVYSEQTTLLEPLATTALLLTLLIFLKRPGPVTSRAALVAGTLMGLSVVLKIWYVATFGFVVVVLLVWRQVRHAAYVSAAGAGAVLLVIAPFAAVAGRRMFDMVIRDQLLRPVAAASRLARLPSIFGARGFVANQHVAVLAATAIVIVVVIVAAVTVARVDRDGSVLVLLLLLTLLILMASSVYFGHYAELAAAPAVLVISVAAARWFTAVPAGRWREATATLVALGVLASGTHVALHRQGATFLTRTIAAAIPPGCVASDDPAILIRLNRLSADLRHGCEVPVDFTGITYDTLHRVRAGHVVSRRRNQAWQRFVYEYLTSASSFVITYNLHDGVSARTAASLRRYPELARSGQIVLQRGRGPVRR